MWIESVYWWIGTMVFAVISFYKQKHFMKNRSFFKDTQVLIDTKQKYVKTIDEQKNYLRAKNNLGRDFITIVFSIFTFYLAFIFLVYPKLPDMLIGVFVVIIFSGIFSIIYAKFMVTDKHVRYNIINAFSNYLYTGLFLVYIKFGHAIHPLVLIIISIILMVGINYLMERLYVRKRM